MNDPDKLRIVVRLLDALRELRGACGDAALRDEAEAVIEFTAYAMLETKWPERMQRPDGEWEAEPRAGEPINDPAMVHKLWRVLNGGRATRDEDDDAIRKRHLGVSLASAANTLRNYPETPEIAVRVFRHFLIASDAAFAALDDATLLASLREYVDGKKVATGVLAELLMMSRALGTTANETRGEVQDKIAKAWKKR